MPSTAPPLAPDAHRVPLDVFERILFFAFACDVVASVTALDRVATPPRSAVPLLLVCRTFHALGSPFFWRSVSIWKSQDWVTLFGAGDEGEGEGERGLLVGDGPLATQRRGWVKELVLRQGTQGEMVAAEIPVAFDRLRAEMEAMCESEGGVTCRDLDRFNMLVRLAPASLPSLDNIFMIQHPSGQDLAVPSSLSPESSSPLDAFDTLAADIDAQTQPELWKSDWGCESCHGYEVAGIDGRDIQSYAETQQGDALSPFFAAVTSNRASNAALVIHVDSYYASSARAVNIKRGDQLRLHLVTRNPGEKAGDNTLEKEAGLEEEPGQSDAAEAVEEEDLRDDLANALATTTLGTAGDDERGSTEDNDGKDLLDVLYSLKWWLPRVISDDWRFDFRGFEGSPLEWAVQSWEEAQEQLRLRQMDRQDARAPGGPGVVLTLEGSEVAVVFSPSAWGYKQ